MRWFLPAQSFLVDPRPWLVQSRSLIPAQLAIDHRQTKCEFQLTVNARHEREFLLQASLGQELVHLLRGAGALKFLAIEHHGLNLLNALPLAHAQHSAAMVPAAVAASDQVRHATALLRERFRATRLLEEHAAELLHLHQADAHDGGLGVIAPAETIDEASSECDHVLERAAEGDAGDVVDDAHVEVGTVKKVFHDGVVDGRELLWQRGEVSRRVVGDGGLGELFGRDLIGDIGAAESSAVDAQPLANVVAEQRDPVRAHINTLDAGNGTCVGKDYAVELLADVTHELVRHVEDEDCGIANGGFEVGSRDHVGREVD
jgi:hypothetical protein